MHECAFSIDDFVKAYKVSRSTVIREINAGRLPAYRVGRRHFIGGAAAREWQRRLEQRRTNESTESAGE